jgi:hypothetical protein
LQGDDSFRIGGKMLNNRGHSDWSGLIWLFLLVATAVLLVEAGLVAVAIVWWKNMVIRVIFGVLAVAGFCFIIKTIFQIKG